MKATILTSLRAFEFELGVPVEDVRKTGMLV